MHIFPNFPTKPNREPILKKAFYLVEWKNWEKFVLIKFGSNQLNKCGEYFGLITTKCLFDFYKVSVSL